MKKKPVGWDFYTTFKKNIFQFRFSMTPSFFAYTLDLLTKSSPVHDGDLLPGVIVAQPLLS